MPGINRFPMAPWQGRLAFLAVLAIVSSLPMPSPAMDPLPIVLTNSQGERLRYRDGNGKEVQPTIEHQPTIERDQIAFKDQSEKINIQPVTPNEFLWIEFKRAQFPEGPIADFHNFFADGWRKSLASSSEASQANVAGNRSEITRICQLAHQAWSEIRSTAGTTKLSNLANKDWNVHLKAEIAHAYVYCWTNYPDEMSATAKSAGILGDNGATKPAKPDDKRDARKSRPAAESQGLYEDARLAITLCETSPHLYHVLASLFAASDPNSKAISALLGGDRVRSRQELIEHIGYLRSDRAYPFFKQHFGPNTTAIFPDPLHTKLKCIYLLEQKDNATRKQIADLQQLRDESETKAVAAVERANKLELDNRKLLAQQKDVVGQLNQQKGELTTKAQEADVLRKKVAQLMSDPLREKLASTEKALGEETARYKTAEDERVAVVRAFSAVGLPRDVYVVVEPDNKTFANRSRSRFEDALNSALTRIDAMQRQPSLFDDTTAKTLGIVPARDRLNLLIYGGARSEDRVIRIELPAPAAPTESPAGDANSRIALPLSSDVLDTSQGIERAVEYARQRSKSQAVVLYLFRHKPTEPMRYRNRLGELGQRITDARIHVKLVQVMHLDDRPAFEWQEIADGEHIEFTVLGLDTSEPNAPATNPAQESDVIPPPDAGKPDAGKPQDRFATILASLIFTEVTMLGERTPVRPGGATPAP